MPDEDKIRVVIVDDVAETRENIRKLLQFEADVEVSGVASTGIDGIKVALETDPDVVLMDINMPDMDGITATEKIRAKNQHTQIVILSVQSDPNYLRKAMLAGARDFLTKPPDVDELTAAIRRAGKMAQQERLKKASFAQAGGTTGTLGFPGSTDGKIIALYSPKGGTGVTTLTANLAVALRSSKSTVAVADGRLQFGDLSFFFNEQGRNNILDLAPRVDELDREIISEVMIEHEDTGIHILAAPPRPEQAENVSGNEFARVLRYLKTMYKYILVDTDSSLNDITLSILDIADMIILVTSQDIPSIKNIRLFLDVIDALGIDRSQLIMTMNRFDKRRNITPERVSDISKQEVVTAIPMDERLVIPAMDRGIPFLIQNHTEPVSKGVINLAKNVVKKLEELKELEESAMDI
jgi:pilus assembly protein CpaE